MSVLEDIKSWLVRELNSDGSFFRKSVLEEVLYKIEREETIQSLEEKCVGPPSD